MGLLRTSLIDITYEKAKRYNELKAQATVLNESLAVNNAESAILHKEITSLVGSLEIVHKTDLGSFIKKGQFNTTQLFAELPDEIDRVYRTTQIDLGFKEIKSPEIEIIVEDVVEEKPVVKTAKKK